MFTFLRFLWIFTVLFNHEKKIFRVTIDVCLERNSCGCFYVILTPAIVKIIPKSVPGISLCPTTLLTTEHILRRGKHHQYTLFCFVITLKTTQNKWQLFILWYKNFVCTPQVKIHFWEQFHHAPIHEGARANSFIIFSLSFALTKINDYHAAQYKIYSAEHHREQNNMMRSM